MLGLPWLEPKNPLWREIASLSRLNSQFPLHSEEKYLAPSIQFVKPDKDFVLSSLSCHIIEPHARLGLPSVKGQMETLWSQVPTAVKLEHSAAQMQTQILEQTRVRSCFQSTCLSLNAAAAAAVGYWESKCLTFHVNLARGSQSQLWHFRSLNYLLLEASLSIPGCLWHHPWPLTHMVPVAGPSPPTLSLSDTSIQILKTLQNPNLASTKRGSVTWPNVHSPSKEKSIYYFLKAAFHFVFFYTKILLLMT